MTPGSASPSATLSWIAVGVTLAPSAPILPGDSKGCSFMDLRKKPFGRFKNAVGGQQKVDRGSAPVDGAVESAPLAANFDVSLVNADRAAMRLSELAKAFLDHRRIGERPAMMAAWSTSKPRSANRLSRSRVLNG
jgi:hypothetical protein